MPFSSLAKIVTVFSLTLLASGNPAPRAACKKNVLGKPKDACCVWYDVLDDIQANLFEGGKCDENAHDSLRLVFHDAIGYSRSLESQGSFPGGGADGSLIAFSETELGYHSNIGLEDIVYDERKIALKHGVSFGDIVQFVGAVGVRNCAGGPRLNFLAGRPDAKQPAPDRLVPDPSDSVDTMLARMADAGFSPQELVSLLASHSVAVQEHIDPVVENSPFDTTPEDFDSQFFLETLLKGKLYPGSGPNPGEAMSPLPGEFRLQSDFLLARDPRTACQWQDYILNEPRMSLDFKLAMEKLAVVGQDVEKLVDCSEVIPLPIARAPRPAHFPAGTSIEDLEIPCPSHELPEIGGDAGPLVHVPPFPGQH